MSSAKKRREQMKSERAAEFANQRRMLAEHHLSIMTSFAEIVAKKYDTVQGMINTFVLEATDVIASAPDSEKAKSVLARLEELRTFVNDAKLSSMAVHSNLQKPYQENLAKIEQGEKEIA